MRARRVALPELGRVQAESWVDPSRRPCILAGTAYVPVREGYAFDCEVLPRTQYRGRGFFMLGDVAIIHGTAPSEEEIGKIVALRKPRGILLVRAVDSPTRRPDCEVLYGDVGEVRHRENGYTYFLDPREVMFSQGNLNEKRRMASLVRSGSRQERVADMFAGIGYFTLPMAGAGARVHAIEINPAAYGYLVRNIAENGLCDRITPSLGNCREMLQGTYDRIVMGHFDAIQFLPEALSHAGAGTVIHLHSLGDVTGGIRSRLAGAGFSADVHVHKVKKYSPHTHHLVADIVIL